MVMWICLTFSPEFIGDPLGNQKVCLIHLLFAILRGKKRHSNVSALDREVWVGEQAESLCSVPD